MNQPPPFNPVMVLGPNGLPARVLPSNDCPRCGKDAAARVASAGFGAPHDVCSKCGFEFEGLTR
jgi:ribosomal protein L37AE/L43A